MDVFVSNFISKSNYLKPTEIKNVNVKVFEPKKNYKHHV